MDFLSPENELTDEQIQQLIELGIIPDQQAMLEKQMTTAQGLREAKGPQMRGQYGRVQTAANPLEFAAHALQGYRAGKELEELRAKQAELLRKQTDGRTLFFKSLRDGSRTEPVVPPYTGEAF